jgi:tRNA 2-selenouridine synthase
MFESGIWWRLRSFDVHRPVFLESESKRIGALQVPNDLALAMRDSECVWVETDMAARVQHLKREYAHFLSGSAVLAQQLDRLTPLHGRATIERWNDLAQRCEWDEFVRELLERHYDPAYTHSIASHYSRLPLACKVRVDGPIDVNVTSVALALLDDSLAPAG